jgi:hypothetical protein
MRVLLAILIALFVLSAGSAVIVYVYDHFSGFSIWNSQIWKTWKIPVIVIAVVAGLALLTTAASLSSKKHERAEKEFALAQGWGYSAKNNDVEGAIPKITAVLERVSPEKKYDVNTVMTVRHEKGNLFLFSCWYNERGAGKYKLGSACLIESDRLRGMNSQVDIVPRTGIDSALMFKQVDMGNSEFARNYIVSAQEPADAHKGINESMKAILVEYKNSPDFTSYNFEINLGPGGLVILRWAQIPTEEWLPLLDLARRLEPTMQ